MEVREPTPHYAVGRAGYQKTDGGLIPVDWRYTRLIEVAKLESGHTPSRRKPSYWSGGIPWVSLHDTENLDANEITQTAQTISVEGLKNSSARLLPKGTVVFSRTATVGKATVIGCEMATSQDFANYICGPDVHNRFLVYLFRHMAPEWKKLMAGSTHNTVYMPAFRSLRVVLPPRSEQEAIAEALSDADALIESLSLLLAKKRQIKQGAMQELLAGKKRLPGYNQAWSEVSLRELFDFKNGLNKAKEFFGHGTPIVNYMDVFSTPALFSEKLVGRVSVGSDEVRNFDVRKGDVFFTRTSESIEEIGLASVMLDETESTVFSGFVLRARPRDNRLHSRFAVYALRSERIREQIVARASYTTRALTNGRLLGAARLLMPPLDEQKALAEILEDMDADVLAVQAKREKALEVKSALMQTLLTGRIRLVQRNCPQTIASPSPSARHCSMAELGVAKY